MLGCGSSDAAAVDAPDAGDVVDSSTQAFDAGGDTFTEPVTEVGAEVASDVSAETSSDAGAGGIAAFNPPFPRIASYRIAGTQHYDTTFQAWASKQAVVIIGGNWEGWDSTGRDREASVHGIKALSKIGTKVLQYNICDHTEAMSYGQPTWKAQVDANNWYLWDKGTSGTHAINFFKSTFWQTNSTDFVPSDSKGHKLEDAFAIFTDATYRTGPGKNAAKSLDGHFHDNLFFLSRTDGDFNRDGTKDAAEDFALAWRKGTRRYFDAMKAIDPDLIRFGNADGLSTLKITDPKDTAAAAPLDGILHGALLEGFMGKSWATETWGGWQKAMDDYRFRLNLSVAPKLGVAGHLNLLADGSDPTDTTPFRAMRYGMASVALEDGYYAYSGTGYSDVDLYSFDELGGNEGGPPVGYLGYPKSTPPTAAWKSGVWRRDFDNGIVLVNPKGNGGKTVSLDGTFKHLKGAQNPTLNDGASVTSVTLADRDGLVLLR